MQPNINVRPEMGNGMGGMGAPMQSQPQQSGSKMPWVILVVVIIVVLGVLGFLFRDKFKTGGSSAEKLSGYQAVFLTNGQVYFGKLSDTDGQYLTLKDIFYLQVNQQLQTGQNGQQQQQQQDPQLSLVKLGNELHGPSDVMKINRDQVLFFEDLKTDGRVVQAIDQYKANPNGSAPQQQQQQQTQPTPTPTATPAK